MKYFMILDFGFKSSLLSFRSKKIFNGLFRIMSQGLVGSLRYMQFVKSGLTASRVKYHQCRSRCVSKQLDYFKKVIAYSLNKASCQRIRHWIHTNITMQCFDTATHTYFSMFILRDLYGRHNTTWLLQTYFSSTTAKNDTNFCIRYFPLKLTLKHYDEWIDAICELFPFHLKK